MLFVVSTLLSLNQSEELTMGNIALPEMKRKKLRVNHDTIALNTSGQGSSMRRNYFPAPRGACAVI